MRVTSFAVFFVGFLHGVNCESFPAAALSHAKVSSLRAVVGADESRTPINDSSGTRRLAPVLIDGLASNVERFVAQAKQLEGNDAKVVAQLKQQLGDRGEGDDRLLHFEQLFEASANPDHYREALGLPRQLLKENFLKMGVAERLVYYLKKSTNASFRKEWESLRVFEVLHEKYVAAQKDMLKETESLADQPLPSIN
ncbi:unnamed protein product [Hyaloperonospora brassicae]|uniref:RxLR effector protein n=1 Tax=Hyaloperonospora brassicae TaxID=162125 RepID=A0AAV0TKX5_HYABA|nr:unnamed protein product [Hyaloperonospora brassicae]